MVAKNFFFQDNNPRAVQMSPYLCCFYYICAYGKIHNYYYDTKPLEVLKVYKVTFVNLLLLSQVIVTTILEKSLPVPVT